VVESRDVAPGAHEPISTGMSTEMVTTMDILETIGEAG
jgi:hypothetical protein